MCTSQQTYYRVQLQGQLQDHRTVSLGDLLPVSWHHRPGGEAHRPFVTHHFQPLGPGRAGPCQAPPAAARCPRGLPLPARVTSAPQGHLATGSLPSIPPVPAAPEALPTVPGRRAAPAAQGSRALPPTARRAPHAAAARSSRLMAAIAGAGSGAGPAGGREARQAPF